MNIKNLILFSFLFMVLAGLTLSSVSALKVPTKYKTITGTNKYYESNMCYYNGEYIWEAKYSSFNDKNRYYFATPTIHEKYSGSQTKIRFNTYNNYGKYKWTDVRSSTLTVNYKILTSTKTYYASKTVKYTKIPKYGMTKTLTFKRSSRKSCFNILYEMDPSRQILVWTIIHSIISTFYI